MAKEEANNGAFGDTKIFIVPLVFALKQLRADILGTSYARKILLKNLSYLGWDVP